MGKTLNIEKIQARLTGVRQKFKSKEVQVGWFPGARYEDGTPVAYIATIQEFGAPAVNIPPRPFMRPAVRDNKEEWKNQLIQGARIAVKGAATVENVLEAVGLGAVGNIQKAITSVTSPPLKESTVQRRLKRYESKVITETLRKPLIDTGHMFATVTHLLVPDGE